jgi:hypothetical protein
MSTDPCNLWRTCCNSLTNEHLNKEGELMEGYIPDLMENVLLFPLQNIILIRRSNKIGVDIIPNLALYLIEISCFPKNLISPIPHSKITSTSLFNQEVCWSVLL